MEDNQLKYKELLATVVGALESASAASGVWCAYSGGLDSTVLLYSLAQLRDQAQLPGPLGAVHIHHGLQPAAHGWVEHCEKLCEGLNIPLEIIAVDGKSAPGESPEAAARTARYGALKPLIQEGMALVTAHHQNDQAETVLLQSCRGAGVKGLAAMGTVMPFSEGQLVRPLLGTSRTDLEAYAEYFGLAWVEDESNQDRGFSRNYIRHEVLPILEAKYPGVVPALARVANHCAEAADIVEEVAKGDLAHCALEGGEGFGLCVKALRALSVPRQKQCFRAWFKKLGVCSPQACHLEELVAQMVLAGPDKHPEVRFGNVGVKRTKGVISLT